MLGLQLTGSAVSFAILITILLYVASLTRQWWRYPHAPGPLAARFTNLWQAHRMVKGQFHVENINLHEKYGEIVRVGPNYYSINNPAAAKIIYGHGTQFIKSKWYEVWGVPHDLLEVNLFAQRDIQQHTAARRRYANLYTMSTLVGYEPFVDNCIESLCQELTRRSVARESLDFSKWFQFYAFDVIGAITFSRPFGFMKTGTDVYGLIAILGGILEVSQVVGLFPALLPVHAWLSTLMSKSTNRLSEFTKDCINKAKKNLLHGLDENTKTPCHKHTPPDFCSKLLAMAEVSSRKSTQEIDPDLLVAGACSSNIFAGSDTTSIILTATLSEILKRPDVLAKLRAELDEADMQGYLSDPPTFQETQRLCYLQAVLKEALRLHPATGIPLWRQVPAGGIKLCGTYLPAGANVGVNSWVAHRNQDVWGLDVAVFNPQRWINATEEQLREMNASFMPFGLGSRTCIGKNISLLEITKVIPHLIRKFDFSLVNQSEKSPNLSSRCAWFVKQREFIVSVRTRERDKTINM